MGSVTMLGTRFKDHYNCVLDPGWPGLKDNLSYLPHP